MSHCFDSDFSISLHIPSHACQSTIWDISLIAPPFLFSSSSPIQQTGHHNQPDLMSPHSYPGTSTHVYQPTTSHPGQDMAMDQLSSMQSLAIHSPTYPAPPPYGSRPLGTQRSLPGISQGMEDISYPGPADYLSDISRRSSDASILTLNDHFNSSRRSSFSSQHSGADSRRSSLSGSGHFPFDQFVKNEHVEADCNRSRRHSNASQNSLPPLVNSSHSLTTNQMSPPVGLTHQAILQVSAAVP